MTMAVAMLLLAATVIGIVLVSKYLRKRRTLRIVSLVLLSLLALALACYIGLCFLFVDAIQHQPPAM